MTLLVSVVGALHAVMMQLIVGAMAMAMGMAVGEVVGEVVAVVLALVLVMHSQHRLRSQRKPKQRRPSGPRHGRHWQVPRRSVTCQCPGQQWVPLCGVGLAHHQRGS
jgi:hypothetical protein